MQQGRGRLPLARGATGADGRVDVHHVGLQRHLGGHHIGRLLEKLRALGMSSKSCTASAQPQAAANETQAQVFDFVYCHPHRHQEQRPSQHQPGTGDSRCQCNLAIPSKRTLSSLHCYPAEVSTTSCMINTLLVDTLRRPSPWPDPSKSCRTGLGHESIPYVSCKGLAICPH